ncbi:G-protein coupled receptors family 1 profile domain-containing protein [Caenorhabditis elegans]|uniref:G-protein coupled receptors family 1 profile domain-containing protein n=1 Tax=Caenorhabditis elegans TaxID=6239 RepID=Q9N4V9_CAEEL|nr:G-protein coupled receptors family 1 profile domain-containing protein [Caenorhabditis elegans]CCD72652.1 G-protein coupled receptors family 1 profile domain-containing protein [Caenorhabditis elegans]|eukprot:NP_503487.1 Serpentine Receptor, class W [Caenorhabditis elegans]
MKPKFHAGPYEQIVNDIANYAHYANFSLCCFALIINLLHLIVLTRKSMRTTSTNVILIGIAFSDICAMSATVYKHFEMVDVENPECLTSNKLWKIYLNMNVWALQYHFRRCSSWLGVLLASVRYVILKSLTDRSKFAKPKVGWKLFIVVQCVSATLSLVYQLRFQVLEDRTIPLPISCAEFQDINNASKYTLSLIPLFQNNNQLVLRLFYLVNGLVTRDLPCGAFPILTFFLLRELRKTKKLDKVSHRSNTIDRSEARHKTTKCIVFMTNAYFIAEAPMGIISLVKVFFNTDDRVYLISVDLVIYFTLLLTINSICHSVICFMMSTQYRKTIWKMFGIRKKKINEAIFFRNRVSLE